MDKLCEAENTLRIMFFRRVKKITVNYKCTGERQTSITRKFSVHIPL
jgi:hypothetical protein